MQLNSVRLSMTQQVNHFCFQVDIVDPLKLTEEFGNILANPVIATRVTATFIVHKGLLVNALIVLSTSACHLIINSFLLE